MDVRVRGLRILVAVAVAAVAASVLLEGAVGGRAASVGSAQPSAHVAVIPGFSAPQYPGYYGVPSFPIGAAGLRSYRFDQLGADAVTPAALQGYDTIVLYGLRWNTLSVSAQAAINAFARTGKVMIWDSDATGAQDYASFVHPFSTAASGENGTVNGSVVSFPGGQDPLASPDPSSPLYLDPSVLVADKNLLNDMDAMSAGAAEWAPSLIAANRSIPAGGWLLAWGYGATGDHSGMVIYSGLDADAFDNKSSPNYALTELAIELAVPFQRTADSSCAPNCGLPGSTGGGTTYAQCSLQRPAPAAWVRGRISLLLRTSIANGIRAKVLTASGKVVGGSATTKPGHLELVVNTRLLPSNRPSKLFAVVYVNTIRACSVPIRLKVDNLPPRLLLLKTSREAGGDMLKLRVNETVRASIAALGYAPHRLYVPAGRTVATLLPGTRKTGSLVLIDRAGNQTTRKLVWH